MCFVIDQNRRGSSYVTLQVPGRTTDDASSDLGDIEPIGSVDSSGCNQSETMQFLIVDRDYHVSWVDCCGGDTKLSSALKIFTRTSGDEHCESYSPRQ